MWNELEILILEQKAMCPSQSKPKCIQEKKLIVSVYFWTLLAARLPESEHLAIPLT
jgi:hypothetical protein